MNNKELKEAIVQMLACPEIRQLEYIKEKKVGQTNVRELLSAFMEAETKYEKVIAFILSQLDE